MMQFLNGGYSPGYPSGLPTTQDAFMDDWQTRMAVTEASRRLSRGFSSQRPSHSTRVSKPSSANNSPRASTGPSRRRTTVNDSHIQSRPQLQHDQPRQHLAVDSTAAPARPVSWHPSTYMGAPSSHMGQPSCYPFSTPNLYSDATPAYPQLSPMMTAYSTNASPCSSFSPLPFSMPPPYLGQSGWDYGQRNASYYPPMEGSQLPPDAPPSLIHTSSLDTPAEGTAMDWNSYMMPGMSSTSPPTPDSFVQTQPAVSQAQLPCESLEEAAEEEGEILVGMGLYDTPDKYQDDPQLNNYRSTVSSLLGSTYRSMEPTGKGLTLEEAWEPPQSDDEGDNDDDEDEDAEAVAA